MCHGEEGGSSPEKGDEGSKMTTEHVTVYCQRPRLLQGDCTVGKLDCSRFYKEWGIKKNEGSVFK